LSIKVVFLDRDGVINEEVGYLHKIEDFKFIDGVMESCNYIQSLGFQIIVITNQSGIARGKYREEDFHEVNKWMLDKFQKENVRILDVFFCPHVQEDNCLCRKPKPGLLINAKEKYDINMTNSWMIGDKEADIEAANNAGIGNTILVRSGHEIDEKNTNATHIFDSILEAITIFKK